ncbi:MAG: hypothetical protein A3F43_02110 [Gammaproteobacteria bacterium RIFCSPHIGHO2_12_FULL_42_10]|nr:MAG: hypothetical protein A3F43_02110 [Gammaproteobacteria bacterium RIFCSPHIGHO2_12_FULL_42_10]
MPDNANVLLRDVIYANGFATLEFYPMSTRPIPTKSIQLRIGDLHGNVLKLIYFLVHENVLILAPDAKNTEMPDDEKSNKLYAELVRIHGRAVGDEKGSLLTKADLVRFREILENASINPVDKIIIIGDDMCDRVGNDKLTLIAIEVLVRRLTIDILTSNHAAELIRVCETNSSFTDTIFTDEHSRSMRRLQQIIDDGLTTREAVLKIVNESYKPCLKALSYTLKEDEKEITIDSHAPIGLETIAALAAKLGVAFNDDSARGLAETIDRINGAFKQYVDHNKSATLYSRENVVKGYHSDIIDVKKDPFAFLTWNRDLEIIRRPAIHKGFKINWVHGHHPVELPAEHHVTTLDTLFGKIYPSPFGAVYKCIATDQRSSPSPILTVAQSPITVPPAVSVATKQPPPVLGKQSPFHKSGSSPGLFTSTPTRPTSVLPVRRSLPSMKMEELPSQAGKCDSAVSFNLGTESPVRKQWLSSPMKMMSPSPATSPVKMMSPPPSPVKMISPSPATSRTSLPARPGTASQGRLISASPVKMVMLPSPLTRSPRRLPK